MAAIVGLESLKRPCRVILHSDSDYVIRAIKKGRIHKWAKDDPVTKVNRDLWTRLLAAYLIHDVEPIWVRGHTGIEGNERCDRLAALAAQAPNLPADEEYLLAQQRQLTSKQPQQKRGGVKMTYEGQPCKKCGTPVVKETPKRSKKRGEYYFEWQLFCPGCTTKYTVEAAKRMTPRNGNQS